MKNGQPTIERDKNGKTIVLPAYVEAKPREATDVQKDYAPHLVAMACGLRNFSEVGKVGVLSAVLTQAQFDDGTTEPCLVIANVTNPRERHVYIPLSQMWRMVDPVQNVMMANALCDKLFGFATRFDCMKLTDALFEFAEDLKNAKPPRVMTSQEFLKAAAADDFKFTINDEKVNS